MQCKKYKRRWTRKRLDRLQPCTPPKAASRVYAIPKPVLGDLGDGSVVVSVGLREIPLVVRRLFLGVVDARLGGSHAPRLLRRHARRRRRHLLEDALQRPLTPPSLVLETAQRPLFLSREGIKY